MSTGIADRKLTTIFYADVAGYSRLTTQDEAGTHQRVMQALDIVSTQITSTGGSVLRYAGDAILAEFSSIVTALNTSIEIQNKLADIGADDLENDKIRIRIGLNIGDVLLDRGEIYGDGVNLAARLESAAIPGGICISSAVYEQITGKLDINFTDGGVKAFKNIANPIHIYHWSPNRIDVIVPSKKFGAAKGLLPSIALEDFACLPNDEENQLFAEELRDQLSVRLSQRTGLRLLETNEPSNPANYFLRGRINRVASKSRSKLSLISSESGEIVWAEGYSDNIDDPLTAIENIVDSVDAALRLQLDAFDTRRLNDQDGTDSTLSELLTRAAASIYQATIQDLQCALSLVEQASAADELNAMALAMRVECSVMLASSLPAGDFDQDDQQLLKLANRSIEIDDSSDYAFCIRGYVYLFRLNDPDSALADAKQASSLSPSYPAGYEIQGLALIGREKPGEAIALLEKAVTLSKKDPFLSYRLRFLALARYLCGDYRAALGDIDLALQLRNNVSAFHQLKGAILTQLGDPTATQWLENARQLCASPHPFAIRVPLPAAYQALLEITPGNVQQPELRIV